MDVYAPEDSFVVKVSGPARVKAGDIIAELDSPDLEKQLDRVQMFLDGVTISARRYSDGRQEEQRKLVTDLLTQLQTQTQAVNGILANAQSNLEIGKGSDLDVYNAQLRASGALITSSKQAMAASQFDRETRDSTDRCASLQKHGQAEIARLKDLQKRLTILAPFSGKLAAS